MIEFLDEIKEHFEEWYPKEACGVLGVREGKLKWFPCKNISEESDNFIFDSREYISISKHCNIVGIVHSHPDSPPDPSPYDIDNCNILNIPYYIFSYPSFELKTLKPENQETLSLYGRDYKFGVTDCFEAMRDYLNSQGFKIPSRALFEDNWWEKGLDYSIEELTEQWNLKKVKINTLMPNDVIGFSIESSIPNHCGVYVGEDLFYHHAVNRLSCTENLYPFWKKYITGVYRYDA
jgi:proteasome lid subunit RPN8/RPN11